MHFDTITQLLAVTKTTTVELNAIERFVIDEQRPIDERIKAYHHLCYLVTGENLDNTAALRGIRELRQLYENDGRL